MNIENITLLGNNLFFSTTSAPKNIGLNTALLAKNKTIKYYLHFLPYKYSDKAIKNTKLEILDKTVRKASKALVDSFVWSDSKEGFFYWDTLYRNLISFESQ